MKQLSKLGEFYDSLSDINIVSTNLDRQRELLRTTIKNFNLDIQKITVNNELLKKNKQLGDLLEQTIAKLKDSSQQWVDNFANLLEQEKFRSDLENYFIVIIFGKVKAGKSSLGNFILRNHTLDKKAKIFKYDEAGREQAIKQLEEIDEDSEFAVNNLECTIEIQGFKLGGMAWVDTPGLGSMVKQNGDLAKQYIKSADYIIYPTSSNAPLQQDEIAQLKELFSQEKPVSICITKSDSKIRKKDKDGKYIRDTDGKIGKFISNKSFEDRVAQEEYVNKEILNILNGNDESILGNIFSISSHTAQKGIDNKDEELFNNSNIPKFYELMTDVVKNKSSKLKSSTPYKGLISFMDNEVLGNKTDSNSSIESILETVRYFDTQIDEANQRFETIKQNIDSDISAEIEYIVAKHQSKIDKGNEKEIFSIIDNELNIRIEEIISKNVQEILGGFTTSLNGLDSHLNSTDEFSIKDEYETISVSYVNNSWTNVWGVFGDRYDSVDESVYMGNNKDETIRNYKENRAQGLTQVAHDNYNMILENFFYPLQNISKDIKQKIDTIIVQIENQKENLMKEG